MLVTASGRVSVRASSHRLVRPTPRGRCCGRRCHWPAFLLLPLHLAERRSRKQPSVGRLGTRGAVLCRHSAELLFPKRVLVPLQQFCPLFAVAVCEERSKLHLGPPQALDCRYEEGTVAFALGCVLALHSVDHPSSILDCAHQFPGLVCLQDASSDMPSRKRADQVLERSGRVMCSFGSDGRSPGLVRR